MAITTAMTEGRRGRPMRLSCATSGSSTKLSRNANASGTSSVRPKYRPATTSAAITRPIMNRRLGTVASMAVAVCTVRCGG